MYQPLRAGASALALISTPFLSPSVSAEQVDCSDVAAWDAAVAYSGGAQVVYRDDRYSANWWSQGMEPDSHSGQWQEWLLDGDCLPESHPVSIDKELMIRDLSVVDSEHAISGALSWQHLITQMMPQENPTDTEKEAFVLHWLDSYRNQQVINGDVVGVRPDISSLFIEPWRQQSLNLSQGQSDTLNLDVSVFRLLAIVFRPDLHSRDVEGNITSAGEARFVYGFLQPHNGASLPATAILEYGLEANSEEELLAWAEAFHELGALEFGEQYNQKLVALTNRFTHRGAVAGKPNGSALNQLRTNELPFGSPWQLREFRLSAETGLLEPATVAQTPVDELDGTATFAEFVNRNEAAILDGSYQVPLEFAGEAFRGGASNVDFGAFGMPISTWNGPGIENNEARHTLGLNTCNGCHGSETGTDFTQIAEREAGQVSAISSFLSGVEINRDSGAEEPFVHADPVSGEPRAFSELADRKAILSCLLEQCTAATQPTARSASFTWDATFETENDSAVTSAQFETLMRARRGRAH